MKLITNDQLVFCLQRLYPDLIPGKDFLVWRQFADDSFAEQVGDAMIYKWNIDREQPTAEFLRAQWDAGLAAAFNRFIKAQAARWQREPLLREADAMVYRAEDAGDAAAAMAARKYRQALRDVPQQSGFPDSLVWPIPPGV